MLLFFCFFNDTATTVIYPYLHTLSLHDALPISLVRRAAIDHVGRWAEWYICEDAEMGLRLLAGGWHSVYTDRRYGYGLTPDSFSGYKSQRFRWAYGAVQIIKRHWRDMLPGADRKLDPMQDRKSVV